MEQNKFGKYLLYAFGEITLVVIGILIALSINNWNESKKIVIKEQKALIDLNNDIKANIEETKRGLKYLNVYLNSCHTIINAIDKKRPYTKDLNSSFGSFYVGYNPQFSTASYENIKIQGINLISNEDLRTEILKAFELWTEIIDKALTKRQFDYKSSVVLPIVTKYFYNDFSTTGYSLIPSNYKQMLQDRSFYNMCTFLATRYIKDIDWYGNFLKGLEDLFEQINKELLRLEN